MALCKYCNKSISRNILLHNQSGGFKRYKNPTVCESCRSKLIRAGIKNQQQRTMHPLKPRG